MCFKINWASLIVGSKFTIFALFYFVFEGNFPSTSPRGAYIWRGDLMEGFLRYRFRWSIFGGAYTWRGLFSEFYGNTSDYNPSAISSPPFLFEFSLQYVVLLPTECLLNSGEVYSFSHLSPNSDRNKIS